MYGGPGQHSWVGPGVDLAAHMVRNEFTLRVGQELGVPLSCRQQVLLTEAFSAYYI